MARSRRNKIMVPRTDQYNSTESARAKQAIQLRQVQNALKDFFALPVERREEVSAAIVATANVSEGRALLLRQNIYAQLVLGLTDSNEVVLLNISTALRELVMDESSGDDSCYTLQKLNIAPILEETLRIIQGQLGNMVQEASKTEIESSTVTKIASNLIYITTRVSEILHPQEYPSTSKNFIDVCISLLSLRHGHSVSSVILVCQCLDSYLEHTTGAVATETTSCLLEQLYKVAQDHDNSTTALAVCVLQRVCFLACKQLMITSEQFELMMKLVLDTICTTINELNNIYAGNWSEIKPQDKDLFEITTTVVLDTLARLALPVAGQCASTDMLGVTRVMAAMLQDLVTKLVIPVLPLALPKISPESEVGDFQELSMMHLMALDYLHNLAWTIAIGDSTDLRHLWTHHAAVVWAWAMCNLSTFLILSEEVADSSLSLMYAIAKISGASLKIITSEINSFIKLYHSSLNADLQTKIVGLLGCLAVQTRYIENNRSVGTFLITVLSALPRTDPEVVIEALNALFDIYADRDYDYDVQVFIKGNFLAHLVKSLPKVNLMRKSIDKRKFRELREQADEAYNNLVSFVDYKEQESLTKPIPRR